MSLDITLTETRTVEVPLFDCTITHNLGEMAGAAGLYGYLWHPEHYGITTAQQLIVPLRDGLTALRARPDYYAALSPTNGWGTYHGLLSSVRHLLAACEAHPEARVEVSR